MRSLQLGSLPRGDDYGDEVVEESAGGHKEPFTDVVKRYRFTMGLRCMLRPL